MRLPRQFLYVNKHYSVKEENRQGKPKKETYAQNIVPFCTYDLLSIDLMLLTVCVLEKVEAGAATRG